MKVCHGSAIALRRDYESAQLRALARQSEDADQVRWLLALALVYDGGSRSAGARAGEVGLQVCRPFGIGFYGSMRRVHLVWWMARRQARFEVSWPSLSLVEDGPILGVHGVVRWRLSDLAAWVALPHLKCSPASVCCLT
jgi:hypothetical protein